MIKTHRSNFQIRFLSYRATYLLRWSRKKRDSQVQEAYLPMPAALARPRVDRTKRSVLRTRPFQLASEKTADCQRVAPLHQSAGRAGGASSSSPVVLRTWDCERRTFPPKQKSNIRRKKKP